MNTQSYAFHKELNLRDLGGYPTQSGKKIKRGLLFRSGALGQADACELEQLHALQLRYILDLRSTEEENELPDPLIEGATQMRMCGATDANNTEINMSPASMYRILFNPRRKDPDPEDSIISAIAEIYSSLAFKNPAYLELMKQLEAGNTPLLFHCTCEKDRTGIAAMIILLALGVDEETVVQDYVLSNEYLQANIEAKLAESGLLASFSAYEYLVRVTEGVNESFGRRVLDEIYQEYGSIDVYLEQEFGLDEARRAHLQELYLED